MSKLRIYIPYIITSSFGNPVGDNGKEEARFLCPKCEELKGTPDKSGHLFVNVKSYKFHCVRCGYCGTVNRNLKIDSCRIYDNEIDKDVEETIREFNIINDSENQKYRLKIPIDKVTTSKSATDYLLKRGFTYEQMNYYDMRVGNLSQEFGRIIIPNIVDKMVYTDTYSARSYIGQTPKYHNPSDIKKSEIVFNLHRIKDGSPIILVEGALTAVAAGYHAVASLGKVLSRSQASQIVKKHPSIIYINYDYGAEKESYDACKLLSQIDPSLKIKQVFMKDDRDAADMSREEYVNCLIESVNYEPFIDDLIKIVEDA